MLLSLSRAGILFFLLGQGVLAVWALRERQGSRQGKRAPRAWSRGAAALLVLCATLAVGGYVAWEKLVAEAASADSVEKLRQSKVDLWPMMADAARAFPVLGMGRGAFEAAFPRYQTAPNPNTLTHPENAVLQLGAEFGVPGLVLLAGMVWGFVRLLRRERLGHSEVAVLAGVAALGLHNLFDFSLELPACAVAVWVALATVARPEEREGAEAPGGTWRLSPLRGLGIAVALAAARGGRARARAVHAARRRRGSWRGSSRPVRRWPRSERGRWCSSIGTRRTICSMASWARRIRWEARARRVMRWPS